jgi:MFS family permease
MTFSSRLHYVWIILVLGTLVVAGALGLARFGYTVVLPAMQEDLGLSNTQTGMLATANMIGYLALSAIGGALASRYGPRIVIVLGLILTGVAMFFTGLAQGFFSAAFWRAVTGIGSGASNVAVMGLIAPWFAPKRRGFESGIIVSGSSVALILIGSLVPRLLALVGNSGWRVCWMIFGAVTFFLALLCALFLRNRPAEVGAQPFGASSSEPSPLTVKSKVMEWGRVYRSIPVWHLGIVYTAFGFSYVIYMTFFAKYLIAEGGYTREAAGNLFMIVGWCSLFCGIIWGTVSDVIGRKYAMITVYLIHAIAFSLFALWPVPPGFTISAILYGLTAWSLPAIIAATCGDVLGPKLAAAAFGFTTIFLGIGQILGPSVAGGLADGTGSFSPAFLLAGGVALLGAIGTSLLRPASTMAVK